MSTQEVLKQNWKEFFMAIAVAVVFVFQSLNSMRINVNDKQITKTSSFMEDLKANREEIRRKVTIGVNDLIDKRELKHLSEYHKPVTIDSVSKTEPKK